MQVYNPQLEYIYRIEEYQSLYAVLKYTGTSVLTLKFLAEDQALHYLQRNHFVVFEGQPYIVKHVEQGLEQATIVAYSGHALLEQRLTGTGQGKREQLVKLGSPDAVVKHFIDGSRGDLPVETCAVQEDDYNIKDVTRLKNLGDEVKRVLDAAGRGERYSIEGGVIMFDTYIGADRTVEGDDPLVFDADDASVDDVVYTDTIVDDQTTVYVGGAGEGADREIFVVGDEKTALDRVEIFTDARDLEEGDTEGLELRGAEKLTSTEKAVAVSLLSVEGYEYGVDFNLGDKVTIRVPVKRHEAADPVSDKLNVNLRITEVSISHEENLKRIDMKFGTVPLIDTPALTELRKQIAQMETVEVPLGRVAEQIKNDYTSLVLDETIKLNEFVNSSMGFYTTVVTNLDGSKTVYTHDEPNIENSAFIAVESAGTYAWTLTGWNDGSPAWQYGTARDGSAVYRLLSTVGLNADWIVSGQIDTDRIYVGSQTLTKALASMQSQISDLASGSSNLILNSAWGTYDVPSGAWWGEKLTWELLEGRRATWENIEGLTWSDFENLNW